MAELAAKVAQFLTAIDSLPENASVDPDGTIARDVKAMLVASLTESVLYIAHKFGGREQHLLRRFHYNPLLLFNCSSTMASSVGTKRNAPVPRFRESNAEVREHLRVLDLTLADVRKAINGATSAEGLFKSELAGNYNPSPVRKPSWPEPC